MQPHLSKSLENNNPPSEAVVSEVKGLLSKPIQELAKKDAEIQHLILALEKLEDERDVIQKSIEECSPILSPIRRLPAGILQEIFCQCLPTIRNSIMSNTEAPLLLTYICRSWRSTALAFHPIWAKLHIPLPPYSPSDSDQYAPYLGQIPMNEKANKQREMFVEKYAKMMQARRKLAETWLSRSGMCPLSISIKYIGTHTLSEDDADDGHVINRIFDTVFSFSQRLDALELAMPFEVYQILQAKISLSMIPHLRKLRVNLYERDPPFPDLPVLKSVLLVQAPSLQCLSISVENIAIFDSNNVPSTWANLTELNFHSPITTPEAIQVLRRCRNLDRCKLAISGCVDVYIDPEDVLALPRLRFLSLQLRGVDSMALLYRRIEAPHLDRFDYHERDVFRSYNHPSYNHPSYTHDPAATYPSPVLSLLERSREIRTLSLDPCILNAQDTLFSFRFMSQLTHLILGKPQRMVLSGGYGPLPGDGYLAWSGPGNFNLDLLTIEEESEFNESHSTSGKEILLPKLEVFEAYMNPIGFTEENLRRFILGRLGEPARRKGISSLRSVNVAFERPMQVDITEEVYRQANDAGVEITLHLDYFPELASLKGGKYTNIFSPWYGLLSSDRSWNYPDADAESS